MAAAANPPDNELNDDDLARNRFRKAMARKKRKEREAEGEIKELNITAMMDIMTIILVFLIKSYTASSVTITPSEDIRPPLSTTRLTPKDTIAITVTPRHILVGDKVKATLEKNMQPRADEMQGKLILPVDAALKKEVEKLKYIAERNPSAPFMREVSIIGDRKIPYEVLSSVLYTAGQNELENFRFVVISSADQ
ncbi:MAG: biopolymer transporter ExbD [Myxococcales bacterium]|nr:biopolymer transporter ExbD [Myxococcales bacterium]MDP3499508.1 biopolymer transporter ExbD [Myxococcales bacterium]